VAAFLAIVSFAFGFEAGRFTPDISCGVCEAGKVDCWKLPFARFARVPERCGDSAAARFALSGAPSSSPEDTS
jgi:hypothetical protein